MALDKPDDSVFAGDIVTGATTVILAMGASMAARSIDEHLRTGAW